MPPISRDVVIKAVEEYGVCWKTQNPDRISSLFTTDAIYIERAFDQKATFKGRKAITEYWKYQICGKQSHIQFRHLVEEMVRDCDRPIAVVKWIAEFSNFRNKRGPKKSNKTVKFVQMAKLIFDESTNQISHLEEYAQDMTGPGCCWPGIDDSITDDEYWKKIRFEHHEEDKSENDDNHFIEKKTSTTPVKVYECNYCHTQFVSRTKLFAHLKQTEVVVESSDENGVDRSTKTRCVPIDHGDETILICFSLSYCAIRTDACRQRLEQTIRQAFSNVTNDNDNNAVAPTSLEACEAPLTWAVPLDLTSSAIVNVGTIKLPSSLLAKDGMGNIPVFIESLPSRLSGELGRLVQNAKCIAGTNLLETIPTIHTCSIVNRPCAPERREFEKYVVFIPWKHLRTNDSKDDRLASALRPSSMTPTPNQHAQSTKLWRRPIEETKAYTYCGPIAVNRVKHGARLMRDYGIEIDGNVQNSTDKNNGNVGNDNKNDEQQEDDEEKRKIHTKLRVRTSTMDEEPMCSYCKVSISTKASSSAHIHQLVNLLISYTRFQIDNDDEFVMALQQLLPSWLITDITGTTKTNETSSELLEQQLSTSVDKQAQFDIILEEPAITKYESKMKIGLCRHSMGISQEVISSIDRAEKYIWMNLVVKNQD